MKTLSFVLAASVLAIAVPAAAQSDLAAGREVVAYADLDLQHPDGMRMLERRVRGAAQRVCGPTSMQLNQAKRQSDCMKAATKGAELQIAAIRQALLAETHRSLRIADRRGAR